MVPRPLAVVALLLTITTVVGCAGTQPTQSSVPSPQSAAGPKRITAAVQSDPPTISSHFITAGSGTIPGGDAIEDLVNAGLVVITGRGDLQPQLAAAVPSLENGLWKLLPDGRMETRWPIRPSAAWHDATPFYPQLLNPNPAILSDVQFRRALLHALDRQELVDTLQEGLVPVAHSFLSPTEPFHGQVEPSIVRYAYDLRRAAQLVEELGYSRGGDGLYRDAIGQRISLEVRTSGEDDTHEAGVFTVADQWKRAGIAAEPFLIPQAQRNDREYNATYPGIRFWRLPNDADDLRRYTSRDAPQPENRFNGGNRSRYMNPAFDALLDRYMSTIPHAERIDILRDIVHHMTDQVVILGLWYNTEPVFIGNRLANITVREVGPTTEAWNAHEWNIKS